MFSFDLVILIQSFRVYLPHSEAMNRKRSLISDTFRVKKGKFGADSDIGNHEDEGAFTGLLRNGFCTSQYECIQLQLAVAFNYSYFLGMTFVLLIMS